MNVEEGIEKCARNGLRKAANVRPATPRCSIRKKTWVNAIMKLFRDGLKETHNFRVPATATDAALPNSMEHAYRIKY